MQGIISENHRLYSEELEEEEDKEYIDEQLKNIKWVWRKLFQLLGIWDIDNILDDMIIHQHSLIVSALCFVFSLETFLYQQLAIANIYQHPAQIKTLGPFASILTFIIKYKHYKYQEKQIGYVRYLNHDQLIFFRGMLLT